MNIPAKEIRLKDGAEYTIRSPEARDAQEMIDYLVKLSHTTDYMMLYPEESIFDPEAEESLLTKKAESERDFFLACFSENQIIGNVSVYAAGSRMKVKHRCMLGIGISEEYRGMGIGTVLMEQAILFAKEIGYEQIELDVVSENKTAICLYEKFGFQKIGVISHGMKRKDGGYYDLNYMVKQL